MARRRAATPGACRPILNSYRCAPKSSKFAHVRPNPTTMNYSMPVEILNVSHRIRPAGLPRPLTPSPLNCVTTSRCANSSRSGHSYAPLRLERQSGGRRFMKTHCRFVPNSSCSSHALIHFPLPIDTWAKRGIYSPHLEFRPLVSVVVGVANGANGTKSFQSGRLARSRSLKQSRLCLKPAWRSHAPGITGVFAFPVQNGRLDFNFYQVWETGSPLPLGKRNSPLRPDLPVLQRERSSSGQRSYDFSGIPCSKALRQGKDFNAIRRGQ
jgi:hypothetical protein